MSGAIPSRIAVRGALLIALLRSAGSFAQVAPTATMSFAPAGIQPNGVSTLTITIANSNASALTGVAFTDTLPANLVVATPNGLANTCGGTATATGGTGSVSLTGGTVAANSSCSVGVNVTAAFTGTYLNSSGPVTSNEAPAGSPANATLAVAFPPTISKLFLPDTIPQNGTSLISFTISNPNSNSSPPNVDVPLTGVAFTDALPAGLAIASPPNASSDCGGTLTAAAGATSLSLIGGAVDPAVAGLRPAVRKGRGPLATATGSCFISVQVMPSTTGTLNNTTGPVTADQSGPGATSNTASLMVIAGPVAVAPTLAKAFGAPWIAQSGATSLTFTVTNPNSAVPLINVGFSDAFPSGLVVATPSGATGTCLTTYGGTLTAASGAGSAGLSIPVLPAAASCTAALNVTGTAAGNMVNVTGAVIGSFDTGGGSFVGLTGNTATATLVVPVSPTLAKAFGSAVVAPGGTTSLTFTLANSNAMPLTGVAFTDAFPAGLVVATPNGLTGSCGGGTITAVAGAASVALVGAMLPASGGCSFGVNVTVQGTGLMRNTTGTLTSNEAATGAAASASINGGFSQVPALGMAGLALLGATLAFLGAASLGRRASAG